MQNDVEVEMLRFVSHLRFRNTEHVLATTPCAYYKTSEKSREQMYIGLCNSISLSNDCRGSFGLSAI